MPPRTGQIINLSDTETIMKKYNLKQDHEAIKKQIKEWELSMDWMVDCMLNIKETTRGLDGESVVCEDGEGKEITISEMIKEAEAISHDMMAVNI